MVIVDDDQKGGKLAFYVKSAEAIMKGVNIKVPR